MPHPLEPSCARKRPRKQRSLPVTSSIATVRKPAAVSGAGLGLRRPLLDSIMRSPDGAIDFLEMAPENWIKVGGKLAKTLRALTERFPLICHGLSLSLGGPSPLDDT